MARFVSITLPILLLVIVLTGCGRKPDQVTSGKASFYADKFHGKKTSDGGTYNKHNNTAAHNSLPFGTRIKVTYPKTGKSVYVRITDRGPHTGGRIIDLSRAAAKSIGLDKDGVGTVELEVYK